jgi:ferritin-like metal-binding protein YciE
MPKQKNLRELFLDTLKDIYFAEKKILTALPIFRGKEDTNRASQDG